MITMGRQGRLSFLFALATVMIMGAGCSKKRDARFAQGQGENLYRIEDFSARTTDTVDTMEKRFRGVTSRADELLVHEGFEQIRSFDEVEFKVNSPLADGIDFGDVKIYGREGTTEKPFAYPIEYKFTDSHVIFYKIADKKDLPSQELTYAEPRGDGRLAVALFGLPISLYTVDKIEDSRGKDTRTYTNFPKDYLKEATHFKVRKTGITYFKAPNKLDLFKSEYFSEKDEWYYTKTIVGRPAHLTGTAPGKQVSAIRMRMVKTKNSILGIDINIPPEQEVLDPQKLSVALEIPVKWVDYRTKTSGSTAFLEQQELDDDAAGSRRWEDREYALVDFNNADRLQRTATQENKLERLEVGQDYIGFLIFESSTGLTWKFSMVKAGPQVAGIRFPAADREYFHIFARLRNFVDGAMYAQTQDLDRQIYMNRYYPENNEIVFYMTEETPKDAFVVNAIRKSVEAWDVAFQKAETGIRIRLDDKRVEMGDVRYNKIAFHGYEINTRDSDGTTLLGLGPNIGDTRTGQVYTSTTNIYMRAYREIVIRSIRNFIRDQLGLYNDKAIEGVEVADAAVEKIVALAHGSTASQIGTGRIGSALASVATGNGMGQQSNRSLLAPSSMKVINEHGLPELAMPVHSIFTMEYLPRNAFEAPFKSVDDLIAFRESQKVLADALLAQGNAEEARLIMEVSDRAALGLNARPSTFAMPAANAELKGEYAGIFPSGKEFENALIESRQEVINGKKTGRIATPLEMEQNFANIVSRQIAAKQGKTASAHPLANGSCQFGSVGAQVVSFEKITHRCLQGKTKFSDYMKDLLEANQSSERVVYSLEGEQAAILECADVLMEELMLSTLMHELGHNFGLGHNFAGTTDPDNFPYAEGSDIPKYRSSTVMEYPNRDFDIFNEVGPYDIAALRYAYGRNVEVAGSGEKLHIDNGVSIADAALKAGKRLKRYKVCDDFAAGQDTQGVFDPMCRRWDAGSDPEEVVDWAITDIMSSFVTSGYSYNNSNLSDIDGGEPRYASAGWMIMKQIYEKFRTDEGLVAQFGPYLEFATDPEQYKANVANFIARKQALADAGDISAREFVSYYKATQKIYDFATDMLFYPAMTCLVNADVRIPRAVEGAAEPVLGAPVNVTIPLEFARVRRGIFKHNMVNVLNCQQALTQLREVKDTDAIFAPDSGIVIESLNSMEEAAKQHTNIMSALSTDEFKTDFTTFNPTIYGMGLEVLKDRARFVLFDRTVTQAANALKPDPAFPNFMDDPVFRDDLINKGLVALLDGSDLAGAGFNKDRFKAPLLNQLTLFDYQDDGEINNSIFGDDPALLAEIAKNQSVMLSQHTEVEATLASILLSMRDNGDRPGELGVRTRFRTQTAPLQGDRISFAFNTVWPATANSRPDTSMVYGYDAGGRFRFATASQDLASIMLANYRGTMNGLATFNRSQQITCANFALFPFPDLFPNGAALASGCGVNPAAGGLVPTLEKYMSAAAGEAANTALRDIARVVHLEYSQRTAMGFLMQGSDIGRVATFAAQAKAQSPAGTTPTQMAMAAAGGIFNYLAIEMPRAYQAGTLPFFTPFGEMGGDGENVSSKLRLLSGLTEMSAQ